MLDFVLLEQLDNGSNHMIVDQPIKAGSPVLIMYFYYKH